MKFKHQFTLLTGLFISVPANAALKDRVYDGISGEVLNLTRLKDAIQARTSGKTLRPLAWFETPSLDKRSLREGQEDEAHLRKAPLIQADSAILLRPDRVSYINTRP